MDKIMIGSARSAKLGDVNSVSEQELYNHKLGWVVIHPKKKSHRHSVCLDMRNACSNNNIVYSQTYREEIYKRGTDCKIRTRADCSSLLTQIVRETMLINFPNSTTATFINNAKSTVMFDIYDYVPGKTELWNGDILCTRTKGHICAVTHGGKKNNEGTDTVGVKKTK